MNAREKNDALEVVNAIRRAFNSSGSTDELMANANEEFFRLFLYDTEAMLTMKCICEMETDRGDVIGASDLGQKLQSICARLVREMAQYMPRVVGSTVQFPDRLVVESNKKDERINVALHLLDFESYPTEESVRKRREEIGI